MEKGLFYRSFEIDLRSVDKEKRSVDISFSSEVPAFPYSWSDIPEILLHGEDNVDLAYLKSTGSVLMNHQPNGPGQPVVIVGKPENVRVENRRGIATIIFDEDEQSDLAFKKVMSGSLRGISVGAQVLRRVDLRADDEMDGINGPAILATKWSPVEISLTPIPVDASVGVNRSLSEIEQKSQTKENPMDEKKVKDMIDGAIRELNFAKPEDIPKAEDIAIAVRSLITEDAKPKMLVDTETLQDLLGRAGAVSVECKSKIMDMATQGKTEPEMLRAITDEATLDPDAGDTGDKGNTLEGKKKITTRTQVKSFEGVDDKDFFGSVCQPSISFN